jgi:hypothetical protein
LREARDVSVDGADAVCDAAGRGVRLLADFSEGQSAMTYIMIILFWSSSTGCTSTTSVEFNSRAACEEARKDIVELIAPKFPGMSRHTICVKKG